MYGMLNGEGGSGLGGEVEKHERVRCERGAMGWVVEKTD